MSSIDSTTETQEVWRDVPGFPGYQVSDHGKVRSAWTKGSGGIAVISDKWRSMRGSTAGRGYLMVRLYLNGKSHHRYIHRLVLEAFVGPCPEGMETRHVNQNDRTNNHLSNLAWGTTQENADDRSRHGTKAVGSQTGIGKLSSDDVIRLKELRRQGVQVQQLAILFDIRRENVSKIVNDHAWTHTGGKVGWVHKKDRPIEVGQVYQEMSNDELIRVTAIENGQVFYDRLGSGKKGRRRQDIFWVAFRQPLPEDTLALLAADVARKLA